VQKHPTLGARKLGNHAMLRDVRTYVAEHHEKWDGTGYPARKKGEDISLAGRILCVVEVFDSLSTKRSYKDVWQLPKVLDVFAYCVVCADAAAPLTRRQNATIAGRRIERS